MKAFVASFSAVLLAAFALSAQATPSQQQQIEIDHCTIMSKAVLEFAKARDQGQAKMDAYNSVTHNQPYKAGSMVDETLQWAYDHADENAEAASAHFYGHCSLDALEALTPQTEDQAKLDAVNCQQQHAARPDETRICMDDRISTLIATASTSPNAPAATTAVAPMPAQSQVQTLTSTQLPAAASAAPVQAPAAAPAPTEVVAPAPEVAQTQVPASAEMTAATAAPVTMPIPPPVRAKPAVPAATPAPEVAQVKAPATPMFPALPPPTVAATPKPIPAPAVAVTKVTPPVFPPQAAPTAVSAPKPAAVPVSVAQAPAPVVQAPAPVAVAQAPVPVAPPPVVKPAPSQPMFPALPSPNVTATPKPAVTAIAVAQAPVPVAPPPAPVAPALIKAPGTASAVSAYVVKAPAPAPATASAQPALAVLSPPSLGSIGKLSLGMAMSDATHTFHSYGDEDQDEFGGETRTFLISDGHGYVVLLTQRGKPETLYGIEYHGGADADTAPTIMGVRLGQSALAVLTHVGEPSRRERLPNSENTRWYYEGRNYAFDISSGGDLVTIRLYGYEGLQSPDADGDTPAPAPVTP